MSTSEAHRRDSRHQTMHSAKERRRSRRKDNSHKDVVPLKENTKKRKIKDAHSSYDSESESNDVTKIDFNEELHPIGYYVKDRTEMINQMFKVIQGKKLKAMLPPLLKGYSIDKLKSLCLEELLGMSEKRVMSVLEGRELETSSESEVHSSEPEAEEYFAGEYRKQHWCIDAETSSSTKTGEIGDNDGTNDAGDMDTLEIGITREEMGDLLNDISCGETSRKKRPKEKRREKPLKHKKLKITDRLKSKRKASGEHTSKQTFTREQEREEDGSDKEESKGKTLLEILELEMRARAIRALLKQQNEEVNMQSDIGVEPKMNKQSAEAITPYMDQQNSDLNVINVDKRNVDAITTNTSLNEAASTDTREKSPNPINRKDLNPQPKKKFKRTSGNVQKKNKNIYDATDNGKVEMDLVSKKIEILDLAKEKLDAKEVKPAAGKSCKTVVCSQSEKTSVNGNKNLTTSKIVEVRDKTLCDNRAALDKAKRRCYRSNQEEGEISSDDENKSDSAHTVKIEPQSDFDLITLDDSNDSIRMLPWSKRHVTIEKSNVSKLTSVTGATNQRLYSEVLRSNIKVHVKNKGKLKTRDTYLDATSFSKTQKGCEENRDEGKNQGIEDEEEQEQEQIEEQEDACEMTWVARWLKSKGVQRVVKTSKVCAKMRKRMKNAQQRSQMLLQNAREESKSPVHIIGSVKEYRMLEKPKPDNKQKDSDDKQ